MTLQIEEKGGRKAIITGREGKEKESNHGYMERDKGGWGWCGTAISSSRSPPKLQSLMTPGPRPSVLANGTHAQRQLCWHVQLFIFGYLLLSLGYPRVDATPESAGRCVDLFWEAGYQCLSAGRIQEAFHVRPP